MRRRQSDGGGDEGADTKLQKAEQGRGAAGVFRKWREGEPGGVRISDAGAGEKDEEQHQRSRQAKPAEPGSGYENKAGDRLERENNGKQDFAIEIAQQNDVQLVPADKTDRQAGEDEAVNLKRNRSERIFAL
jgi:hypothetical protein